MRPKIIFTTITLLVMLGIRAQQEGPQDPNPLMSSLSNEVPQILPPTPSVAALMRFEEIPVNNYTGIPDINIPLFSSGTLSSDVGIAVSLNYHPLSNTVDAIAPYTGLGWSLMAGGTISRTVRGFPDEFLDLKETGDNFQMGIYYDDSTAYGIYPKAVNHYPIVEGYLLDDVNGQNDERVRRFKFGAFEKGLFDTQYDLYQFNAMGMSGRFIIKKADGVLTPVMIDHNPQLKIEIDYSLIQFHGSYKHYVLNGFTIKDEKGIAFKFYKKEIVEQALSDNLVAIFQSELPGDFRPQSHNPDGYPTAFHLTEIRDQNNNLLAEFTYSPFTETNITATSTKNTPLNHDEESFKLFLNSFPLWGSDLQNLNYNKAHIEPYYSRTINTITTITQKLTKIEIINFAEIEFDIKEGVRQDIDMNYMNRGARLDKIFVSNAKGDTIKEVKLDYAYFSHPYGIAHPPHIYDIKRMILEKVSIYGEDLNEPPLVYGVEYKKEMNVPADKKLRKDPWGYFEIGPRHLIGFPEPIEKEYITEGTISKLKLPTGGEIQFEFEPNTYSYIGDQEIDDFDESPYSYIKSEAFHKEHDFYYIPEPDSKTLLLDNLSGSYVGLEVLFDPSGEIEWRYGDRVYIGAEFADGSTASAITKEVEVDDKTFFVVNTEPGKKYFLKTTTDNSPPPGDDTNPEPPPGSGNSGPYVTHVKFYTIKPSPIPPLHLQGGGMRIKEIRFDDNNPAGGTEYPSLLKNYDYNFFDTQKSSGSLVFPFPKFEYVTVKSLDKVTFNPGGGAIHSHLTEDILYQTETSFNNLSFLRTQGADVGYENVTITSLNNYADNGKTQFTYISPREYPEINTDDYYDYTIIYPFTPTPNYDYLRGKLKMKKVFDAEGRILHFIENEYNIVLSDSILTGVKLARQSGGSPFAYIYSNYGNYVSHYNNCTLSKCVPTANFLHSGNCMLKEGNLHTDIGVSMLSLPIYEARGWSALEKSTTTEYFHENGLTKEVETVQEFTYDPVNKQVKTQKTKGSLNENLETIFYYPQNLTSNYEQEDLMDEMVQRNQIGEAVIIQTKNNNIYTGEKRNVYKKVHDENGNKPGYILPEFVYLKKGNESSVEDNRITYLYNDYGQIIQYNPTGGLPVSIIWGYNSRYPIAKVEGFPYTALSTTTLGQLSSESNSYILTYQSFDNLRNETVEGMVTGYVYKPLIGVTEIVAPNGSVEHYGYDGFGRLMKVKDAEGNVLRTIDYNYRNSQP